MPYDLEFTVKVSVNTEDEARRMMEAVYSGYAVEIMKVAVLYGQIPVGGVVPTGATPQNKEMRQEPRQREPAVELKRVETKVGAISHAEETEKAPRARGLSGRKRLGRA